MIAGAESLPEIRDHDGEPIRFRAWRLYGSVRYRFDAYARPIGRAGSAASLALTSCRAAPESGRRGWVIRP
jgi:hypothetical protein